LAAAAAAAAAATWLVAYVLQWAASRRNKGTCMMTMKKGCIYAYNEIPVK
jgi:hypothetical protein